MNCRQDPVASGFEISEILDNILARLPATHLKNARLVNRKFADVGARYLRGDTVIVSPQEAQLNRLNVILENPIICRNIRTVQYDISLLQKLEWVDDLDFCKSSASEHGIGLVKSVLEEHKREYRKLCKDKWTDYEAEYQAQLQVLQSIGEWLLRCFKHLPKLSNVEFIDVPKSIFQKYPWLMNRAWFPTPAIGKSLGNPDRQEILNMVIGCVTRTGRSWKVTLNERRFSGLYGPKLLTEAGKDDGDFINIHGGPLGYEVLDRVRWSVLSQDVVT